MLNKELVIAALSAVMVLSACMSPPASRYADSGAPESLLDLSSEVVNLGIMDDRSIDELAQWIQQDQPTVAELYCPADNMLCAMTQDVLDLYGVPTHYIPANQASVSLIYERILARSCDSHYSQRTGIDYHLNHPNFGCANAKNMLQMVSDKQQIVNPNLMDYHDAKKMVGVYRNYLVPTPVETLRNRGAAESLVGESSTQ